jgi:hypothetical protein
MAGSRLPMRAGDRPARLEARALSAVPRGASLLRGKPVLLLGGALLVAVYILSRSSGPAPRESDAQPAAAPTPAAIAVQMVTLPPGFAPGTERREAAPRATSLQAGTAAGRAAAAAVDAGAVAPRSDDRHPTPAPMNRAVATPPRSSASRAFLTRP